MTTTLAFTYPGQGSQAIGMGKAFADAFSVARDVFAEVDDVLSQPLSRIIFEGPESELTLTANTQPAIMATSIAIHRVLEKELGLNLASHARFVAGHSLGEYSALCAAGTLSLADAARLLRIRGEAMQAAVPVGEGAMAAILGLDIPDVQAIAQAAASKGACEAANDNSPGQVVISGSNVAVAYATELAKEKGAKRAVLLPVSAPFHCSLMQPAAERMAEALAEIALQAPVIPLVANVTATATSNPDTIRTQLVQQVTGMVRWRESVSYMKEQGVQTLVEVGHGKVLSGLARRIDRELESLCIQSPEDLDALAKLL